MKRIHYAGENLVTGDAIADALVFYAEALARRETSAAIEIPALFAEKDIRTVTVLLGPASQLVAIPEDSATDDLFDEELVARMKSASAALGVPQPQSDDDRDHARDVNALDL